MLAVTTKLPTLLFALNGGAVATPSGPVLTLVDNPPTLNVPLGSGRCSRKSNAGVCERITVAITNYCLQQCYECRSWSGALWISGLDRDCGRREISQTKRRRGDISTNTGRYSIISRNIVRCECGCYRCSAGICSNSYR